jgi:hypothetical protein
LRPAGRLYLPTHRLQKVWLEVDTQRPCAVQLRSSELVALMVCALSGLRLVVGTLYRCWVGSMEMADRCVGQVGVLLAGEENSSRQGSVASFADAAEVRLVSSRHQSTLHSTNISASGHENNNQYHSRTYTSRDRSLIEAAACA